MYCVCFSQRVRGHVPGSCSDVCSLRVQDGRFHTHDLVMDNPVPTGVVRVRLILLCTVMGRCYSCMYDYFFVLAGFVEYIYIYILNSFIRHYRLDWHIVLTGIFRVLSFYRISDACRLCLR